MNLTIPGPIPSKKNSKRRIMRGRSIFMVPSIQHERWHREAMRSIRQEVNAYQQTKPGANLQGKVDMFLGVVEILFFFPDNRKRDMTNAAESIMDLLVDMEILRDDCWQVVRDLTLKSAGIDRIRPRAEVFIYERS